VTRHTQTRGRALSLRMESLHEFEMGHWSSRIGELIGLRTPRPVAS
jgi:hypothetical protein